MHVSPPWLLDLDHMRQHIPFQATGTGLRQRRVLQRYSLQRQPPRLITRLGNQRAGSSEKDVAKHLINVGGSEAAERNRRVGHLRKRGEARCFSWL